MNFNWVYVNSFHEPGASGSLYAVKDAFRLNPLFRTAGNDDDSALRGFTAAARQQGLDAMMDLSIGHLARDSVLVAEHPEWFRRRPDGELLSPSVTDPADPHRVTVWHDLAALNYDDQAARMGLIAYWLRYIRHYRTLGFRGFFCKSAYLVPAEIWRAIVSDIRRDDREARFIAETVGARIDRVELLAGVGFDYVLNNAKWWDFRSDWLLDQQARLTRIAPSIAFPESHDTDRLAASEVGDRARLEMSLRFRALFAASFAAGWMMPVGYEYGFTRKLDVIHSRPDDWETPNVDLTEFISAVNNMKANCPALNVEGGQRRITAPGNPVTALLRLPAGQILGSTGCAVVILNPDHAQARPIDAGSLLTETGGRFDRFLDVTPFRTPARLEPGPTLVLDPLEVRVFRGDVVARPQALRPPAASEKALRALVGNRIAIENVDPELDGGRFPVKRVVGDVLEVQADIFIEGHDLVAACVKYKESDGQDWREAPMSYVDNDRWAGHVPMMRNTTYLYTIEAWRDRFETWRTEFIKKRDAGQDISLELQEGLDLVKSAVASRDRRPRDTLQALIARTELAAKEGDELARLLLSEELRQLMARHAERSDRSRYHRELAVIVDRLAARYSTWYELFPRSQTDDVRRSGTFDDVIRRLPYVRDLGCDVLYFPPIHPIGHTKRKGRNNSLAAGPDDPGSPYAIGAESGGHTAVHPDLGTLEDFRRLVHQAHEHGIEIALDFAIQCSLDHPWVREHPDWFDWRPDGSLKYAENPPKKYEDIVNPNFYRALPDLWFALRDVVLFWIEQGVRIFRVDNPHTKPLPFWEWMIGEVRERYPDVVFLSEAFTRPKMMRRLAKVGFNQSYTYFTWRNTKQELIEYLTDLSQGESSDYLRPNFFANTPDINPVILQTGGRPAFMSRAALAATLSSAYGIYSGYELCEAAALPGREEYLDSEKYEIKPRDWDKPGNIRAYIERLNRIRRDNPALHDFRNLRFYNAYDDQILVYGKMTRLRDNVVLVAVNLDPRQTRGCHFEVPLWELGLPDDATVQVEDLFTGRSFSWSGKMQHVALDPQLNPAAIWRITAPLQDQFVRQLDRSYRPHTSGAAA
jgi:starch synthase (maltosyl-transferring)